MDLPIAVLSALSLSPTKLEGLKFLPIYEALTIRAQKTAPPYIAFEEVNKSFEVRTQDDWSRIEASAAIPLVLVCMAAKLVYQIKSKCKKLF